MTYSKKDELTARKIRKNAATALTALSAVADDVSGAEFKAEIKREYDGYEAFIKDFSGFLTERGIETGKICPLKKWGMLMGIKSKLLFEKSDSLVATLVLRGTVTGISELIKLSSEQKDSVDQEILRYLKRLRDLEEEYEERIKAFI